MAMIMLEYTPPTIVLGGQSDVFVTHVVDPSHFHCQLQESAGKLDILMDKLHVHCANSDPQKEGLRAFELGTPCLAQYSGDQGWYRVIITGMLAGGLAEVSFVDYGNNEVIPYQRLRKMKPEFMELPIQAIQCGMSNIVSPQGFWLPEHIAQFEDLILEKSFTSKFISLLEGDSVCCVELLDKTGKSMNKLFGTTTGILKTPSRTAQIRGREDIQVSVTGDDNNRTGAFRDAASRKPLGSGPPRERQSSSGSESSGSGRRPFVSAERKAPRFRSGEGDREFSGTRDRKDTKPFQGNKNWGEDNAQPERGFGDKPTSRRGNFSGHDDRLTTDYNGPSNHSNQRPTSGNTWASGFGKSNEDHFSKGQTDMDTSFKCLTLGLGEKMEVYVAFVKNPDEFWIQFSANTELIDNLMEELNNTYSSSPPSQNRLQNPREGSVCAAQYAEDGRWYRAVVKRLNFDDCEVHFVDYGNSETVEASSIKSLAPNFLSTPVQAVKCCLDSVTKIGPNWSDPAIRKFEELTLDKPLTCNMIGPGAGGAASVHLTDLPDGTVIGEALIQLSLAVPRNKAGVNGGTRPKEPPMQPPVGNFKQQSISVGQKAPLVVSWMIDPENFWCQLVSSQQDILNTNISLQTVYNKSRSGSIAANVLKKGMPVIAKFSEDGCWYRGQVVQPGSSQIQVLFVDYGNTESVTLSSLQFPQENSMATPMLSVKCSFKDVKPATGNQWSEKTVGFLESIIGDQATGVFYSRKGDTYMIDIISGGKNAADELVKAGLGKHTGVQPATHFPKTPLVQVNQDVKLFVTSIDSMDSFWCQPSFAKEVDLESAYSSPVDTVNNPTKGTACVTKFSGDGLWYRAEVIQVANSDVTVRFVDYGNSEVVKKNDLKIVKSEFIDLPAQSFECALNGIKDHSNDAVKNKFNELTNNKEIAAKITGKKGDVFLIDMYDSSSLLVEMLLPLCSGPPVEDFKEFLPVPDMTGKTTKAYVSATFSVDEFYLQPSTSQPELDKMTELMKQYHQGGSSISSPIVGQACAAKYAEDGAWYRCRITAISGNSVKGVFVDYGNYENVPLQDLKSLLSSTLEIPPKAFPCSVAGMKPAGGVWTTEALALFEDTVMDKELTCTFVTKDTVKMLSNNGDVFDLMANAGHSQSNKTVQVAVTKYEMPQSPGSSFKGFVTHSDSTGIYIQPTVFTEQIDMMTEELQNLSQQLDQQTPLTNIDVNSVCCAKYSVDNSWYRAIVSAKSGSYITVRFVDFGNLDTLSQECIKELPAKLSSQAPLALQSLPKGRSSLTLDEAGKITDRVADVEILVNVVCNNFPFQVDISDENGSIFPASEELVSQSTVDMVNMPITLPKVSVLPGILHGYITEVDQAGLVFVQRADDEDKVASLTEKLQTYEQDFQAGKYHLNCVEVGTECCAKFSEDQAWYRAEVLKIDDQQATVRFIDFGNKDVSNVSELRAIPQEFMTIPHFCIVFKGNFLLSGDKIAEVMEYVDGKAFEFELTALCEPFDLVARGLEGRQLMEKLSSKDSDSAPVVSSRPVEEFPSPNISAGMKDGYVAVVETSLVYIQLVRDEEKLAALTEKVQQLADSMLPLSTVSVGSICCAQFTEDGMWYRAFVEDQDEKIKVRFVDYGNVDLVNAEDLRTIHEELLSEPCYALKCRLKDKSILTATDVSELTEKTEDKVICVEFFGETEPYEISLISEGENLCANVDSTPVHVPPVKPMTTCKYRKQPLADGELQAFVSHYESSGVFYVQLDKDTSDIDHIAEQMEILGQNYDKIPGNMKNLSCGSVCCCRFPEDNTWYRAQVLETNTPGTVTVKLVDYGNHCEIEEKDLYELPESLSVFHPLAFGCKFPIAASTSSLKKFREITDGVALLIRFQQSSEPYTVTIRTSEGEPIETHLTSSFEQCADESSTDVSSDDPGVDDSKLNVKYSELSYPVGHREEVYISHSEFPQRFWCQPAVSADQLTELMDEIANHCAQLTESKRVTCCKPGLACIARCTQDQGWYRATVLRNTDTGVEVFFVDYGNSDIVKESDIVTIEPEHATLPVQAVECKLHEANQTWSQESIDLFNNVTTNKKLLAEIQSCDSKDSALIYFIHLLDMGENILTKIGSVVEDLIDSGTSTPSIIMEAVEKSVSQLSLCEGQTLTDSLQVQVSDSPSVFSETIDGIDPSTSSSLVSSDSFTKITLTEGSRIEVVVSHAIAPSQFWVHQKSKSAELRAMTDMLSEAMESVLPGGKDLAVDQPCVARSSEDGLWYRSVIQEINSALEVVDVFYVDYGLTESVEKDNIREIPPEFVAQPAHAIECGLSGIRFQGSSWTDEAKARFQELVLEKTLIATVLQVGEDDDCIIQLLDMGICVAKRLIDEQLGVDADTPIRTPPHLRRVFTDTPIKTRPDIATSDLHITSNVANNGSIKRQQLKVGEQTKVNVCHAESPGDFWCHLFTALPQIEDIAKQADAESRMEPMLAVWQQGEVCLAQSNEDQLFYRAEILSLKEDKAEVFYIDHGNTEEVVKLALLPLSTGLLSPLAQAIHCTLSAVRPEGAQWEDTSCSRFEEMTYQKELLATVHGLVDNTYEVSLSDGEVAINDSLVQGGYAVRQPQDQSVGFENDIASITPATPTVTTSTSLSAASVTPSITPSGISDGANSALLGAVSQALQKVTLESTPFASKPTTTDLPSPITGSDHGDTCGPDLNDVTCHTIELQLSNYHYLELDDDTELSVFVCNVIDPGNFGIQPQGSSARLETLMADIAEYAQGDTTPSGIDQLEKGSPCLAQFSEDEAWYRARVTDVRHNKYFVMYVDYGNTEWRSQSTLQMIPESMLKLPAQYIPALLADIWSDGDTWLPDTVSFFKDMCDDKPLKAHVLKKEDDFYHVYLFDSDDQTGWSLNRYLLSQGVELIPGSELDQEIQTEDTAQPDQESSFHDLSMTRTNMFDDCDDEDDEHNDSEEESDKPEESSQEVIQECKEVVVEEIAQNATDSEEESDKPEESSQEVTQGIGENDNAEEDQNLSEVVEKSATEAEQAQEVSDGDLNHWEDSKDSFG